MPQSRKSPGIGDYSMAIFYNSTKIYSSRSNVTYIFLQGVIGGCESVFQERKILHYYWGGALGQSIKRIFLLRTVFLGVPFEGE